VVFFLHEAEAQAAGYRPCSRCRPDRIPDAAPTWVNECLEHLRQISDRRVPDAELAAMAGVDISTLRRTFSATLGQTPSRYHRTTRLQMAARLLASAQPVVQVSEATGFESLSGFTEAFRKQFGCSPGSYVNR
jgi:AraC family transcriptional regulator of adaptative response / DNA-3-methyladenine glycosylase II